MVEFDSGLMRTDPKSTSLHQQKPELCNEGKPSDLNSSPYEDEEFLKHCYRPFFFMVNSENQNFLWLASTPSTLKVRSTHCK